MYISIYKYIYIYLYITTSIYLLIYLDAISTENAINLSKSRRWSLMIDRQVKSIES